jgi:hypothetical protein
VHAAVDSEEIMSTSEILGTIRDGKFQVCATAEAEYDHDARAISIVLDAFTRKAVAGPNGTHLAEPWLPKSECVREHLSREEADDFVKDVFHGWVKKVRASIPADSPLHP